MITIQEINGHTKKMGLAYEKTLLPLARESGMPHTAINILLFIANNPEYATASCICEMRGLKRPVVSTHVEHLVQRGYIVRRAVPGDRRKDALICTEKAIELINKGRERQFQFVSAVLDGISEEDLAVMERCFGLMNQNIDRIIKEK